MRRSRGPVDAAPWRSNSSESSRRQRRLQPIGGHRHPRGHLVSAALEEQFLTGAGRHRAAKIDALH